MSDDGDNLLLTLVAVFAPFSLLSLGGGSAIIPGVQRQVVEVHGWLTQSDFVEMFAVARAAPGPGSMLSTLIGWKVAGWAGAVVATSALILPSALLSFLVFRLFQKHQHRKWNRALRKGLAPVGVGLTLAACMTIFRISGGGAAGIAITGLATGLLLWRPGISAVPLMLGGASLMVAAGAWLPQP